jgi:apolipoprotein D and lipocalin family protein
MRPSLRRVAIAAIGFLAYFVLLRCSPDSVPLILAPEVDLGRYAGRWYVIANIPWIGESGNVGAHLDISFQSAGTLTESYHAHPGSLATRPVSFTLHGYVVPGTGNARWQEGPFWPLYLPSLILYVDPNYQTALIGYPGRFYGWVLARTPIIRVAVYQSLLGRMKEQGYNIALFHRVPQTLNQIGDPGFQ